MAKKVQIKTIAKAMLNGLKLAYGRKLRSKQRELLYELLDDMAVGLTKEGVEEDNGIFRHYAGVLGALCDEIDLPTKPQKWKHHKEARRGTLD